MVRGVVATTDWPWSWVKVASYIQRIENAYQQASILNAPPPPPHILFDGDELEAYFQEFRDNKDGDND
jgi:hypothetical protein